MQVIWYSWYPQETDGTTPAECLGLWVTYLPPPLTGISGFHLSNFIMIFSFFYLTLDLVPPKFVIRRVLSMSKKCRLSFTNPRFRFFKVPGTVSWVFLNYFSWKEGINSRSKFHHQQPELVFTRLSIKNQVPFLLGHPAAQRTPCSIAHIAWIYFLNDRFVFGWYDWSGQDGIMIRWCNFGQLRYTEQLWSICKKNQSNVPESLFLKVTSCLRWLAWDISFDFNQIFNLLPHNEISSQMNKWMMTLWSGDWLV